MISNPQRGKDCRAEPGHSREASVTAGFRCSNGVTVALLPCSLDISFVFTQGWVLALPQRREQPVSPGVHAVAKGTLHWLGHLISLTPQETRQVRIL